VAFVCDASNLVASDTDETADVFVRDPLLDATLRGTSHISAGRPGGLSQ
jgi:hypothetical protein